MASTPVDLMEKILDVFDDPCWKTMESNTIHLPEIVVVGAQSSGKSSVLSEILGVPFPVSDDLCTKFVTRLVSRRQSTPSMTVRIIPDPERLDREKTSLLNHQPPSREPKEVDKIIEAVARRLGVEGEDMFSRDVLEMHIGSPESPSITLVDLPGYIEVPSSDLQSEKDVTFIQAKLAGFMDNPRCRSLAIIDGSKDIPSNKVIEYVTHQGRENRTIGVLTKPDLIQGPGVLDKFFNLVVNENTRYRLGLGWYVLRNRGPMEASFDQAKRDQVERSLLSSGKWASLPPDRKGIASLRAGLTRQAVEFLRSQLPPLLLEVTALLSKIEVDILEAPKPVSSASQARDVLYTHLNTISRELDSAFATSTFNISLPPTHVGSWIAQPSKLLTDLNQQHGQLLKVLQDNAAPKSSPYKGDSMPLREQAKSLL